MAVKKEDEQDLKNKGGADEEGGEDVQSKPLLDYKAYLEKANQIYLQIVVWCKENQKNAVLIAAGILLVFFTLLGLFVWHIIDVYNRPTLDIVEYAYSQAVSAKDEAQKNPSRKNEEKTLEEKAFYGSIGIAKAIATDVLRYAKKDETEKKSKCLYVMGTMTNWQADYLGYLDQKSLYLAAVNFLEESKSLGLSSPELDFELGKAYYKLENYAKAKEPLLKSLEGDNPDKRLICEFLADSYFYDTEPNFDESLRFVELALQVRPQDDEQFLKSRFMKLLIWLKQGRIADARKVLQDMQVSDPSNFKVNEASYRFLNAQILLEEARRLRQAAITLEQQHLLSPSEPEQDDTDRRTPLGTTGEPNAAELVLPAETGELIIPDMSQYRGQVPTTPAESARQYRQEAEAKYAEALAEFEASIVADAKDWRWVKQSRLFASRILEESGKYDEAQAEYLRLISGFPDSAEAIAADFFWSEIEERMGRIDSAQDGFRRVVTKLKNMTDYANPWLSRQEIYGRIQAIFSERLELNRFQSAFDLLAVLDTVLPRDVIARMSAVGLNRWAQWLQTSANASAFEEQEKLTLEAREKFQLSGNWFAQLAKYEYGSPFYIDNIWNSAENYRWGRAYRKAIPMYLRYLELEGRSRQQQTLIYLGEMYFELGLLDRAAEFLEDMLKRFPGTVQSYYAALLASYVYMEKGDWKRAEYLLRQNLAGVLGPDSPEFRDSLFALGRLYFRQKKYDEAIVALEDATVLHPNAIQTPESHYLIALAYLQGKAGLDLSEQGLVLPSAVRQFSTMQNEARAAALTNLRKAMEQLADRQDAIGLTQAEQKMQRNCFFGIGGVLVDLGPDYYDEAARAYRVAATRYQNIPESLQAMIQVARILRAQGKREEATDAIKLAQTLLGRLTAANAFPQGRRFTSAEWEELLRWQRSL